MDCIIFHGDRGEASRRQVRSAAAQHSHRIGPRKPKSSKKPRSEESSPTKRTLKANPIVPYQPEHSTNRTAKEQYAAASSSSGSGSTPEHAATPSPRPLSSRDGSLYTSNSPRQDHLQTAQLDAKVTMMYERLDRQKRMFEEDQARRQRQRRIPPLRWKQTIITGDPPSPPPPPPAQSQSSFTSAPPESTTIIPTRNPRADSAAFLQPERVRTAAPPPPIAVERIPQTSTTTSTASHSRQSSGASPLSPSSHLPLYSWIEYPRYSQSQQKYEDPRGTASSIAPSHAPAAERTLPTPVPSVVSAQAPASDAAPRYTSSSSSSSSAAAVPSAEALQTPSIAPDLSAALFRSAPQSWRPLDSQDVQPRGVQSEQSNPRPDSMRTSDFPRPSPVEPRVLSRPMSDSPRQLPRLEALGPRQPARPISDGQRPESHSRSSFEWSRGYSNDSGLPRSSGSAQ